MKRILTVFLCILAVATASAADDPPPTSGTTGITGAWGQYAISWDTYGQPIAPGGIVYIFGLFFYNTDEFGNTYGPYHAAGLNPYAATAVTLTEDGTYTFTILDNFSNVVSISTINFLVTGPGGPEVKKWKTLHFSHTVPADSPVAQAWGIFTNDGSDAYNVKVLAPGETGTWDVDVPPDDARTYSLAHVNYRDDSYIGTSSDGGRYALGVDKSDATPSQSYDDGEDIPPPSPNPGAGTGNPATQAPGNSIPTTPPAPPAAPAAPAPVTAPAAPTAPVVTAPAAPTAPTTTAPSAPTLPAATAPAAPTAPVVTAPAAPAAPVTTAPAAPTAPAATAPAAPTAPAATAPTAPTAPAATAPAAPVIPAGATSQEAAQAQVDNQTAQTQAQLDAAQGNTQAVLDAAANNTQAILDAQQAATQTQVDAAANNTQAILDASQTNTQTQVDAAKENTQAILDNQTAQSQAALDAAQANTQAQLDAAKANTQTQLDAAVHNTQAVLDGVKSSGQAQLNAGQANTQAILDGQTAGTQAILDALQGNTQAILDGQTAQTQAQLDAAQGNTQAVLDAIHGLGEGASDNTQAIIDKLDAPDKVAQNRLDMIARGKEFRDRPLSESIDGGLGAANSALNGAAVGAVTATPGAYTGAQPTGAPSVTVGGAGAPTFPAIEIAGHPIDLSFSAANISGPAYNLLAGCRALIALAIVVWFCRSAGGVVDTYAAALPTTPSQGVINSVDTELPLWGQAKAWATASAVTVVVLGALAGFVALSDALLSHEGYSVATLFTTFSLDGLGYAVSLIDQFFPVGTFCFLAIGRSGLSFVVAPVYVAASTTIRFLVA